MIPDTQEKNGLEGGYIKIYKVLFKHYGPDTSVYLSYLIEKCISSASTRTLIDGFWFSLITEEIKNDTGLSKYQQRECKNRLVKDEIISTIHKGYPRKELFKINWNTLFSAFR